MRDVKRYPLRDIMFLNCSQPSLRIVRAFHPIAHALLIATLLWVPGCGKPEPAPQEPAPPGAVAFVGSPPGYQPPDRPEGAKPAATLSAPALLDPWFVTGDFHVAFVIQPQTFFKSELFKLLPPDLVDEHLKNLERDILGVPVDSLSNVELVATLTNSPSDLAKLPGINPGSIHAAVYVRFTKPTTIEQLAEVAKSRATRLGFTEDAKLSLLEKAEIAGKSYYRIPFGGLIPIDDRTFVAATTLALKSVVTGKPTNNLLSEQLSKADASSELVVAFGFDKANDQLADVIGQVAGGLSPEVAGVTRRIQGGCMTAGVSGTSLLKIMISGQTAADGEIFEAEATKGLNQLKMILGSLPASRPDEKPLAEFAGKMLMEVTLKRSAETVTLDLKNPSSWKDVFVTLKPQIQEMQALRARRDRLHQIGLAFYNYHEQFSQFPVTQADSKFHKDGKPLLSWRVHLLPFLEENELAKQVKLDEPPDSATNNPLLATAPPVFLDGTATDKRRTRIVRPAGPQTLSPLDKKMTIADAKDGLSNTILAIELPPGRGVAWGSPEDVTFNPEKPLDGIGPIPPEGLLVLFADGAVYTLKSNIKPEDFKALVTPAGSENVQRDDAVIH